MRSARASVVLLPATLLLAAVAAAQIPSPTGNIYGTALDVQEKPLSGATVTLSGPGAAHTTNTDTRGDFHFLNLSPGAYSVRLELKGFETTRRDVAVVLGKNAVLAITMQIVGAQESVTVSGEGPLADSRKTETGATYGQKELRSIPTTRDPWAILRQVPGVLVANMNVGGGQSAQQSVFVGKGSHSDQNIYNLDGVAISIGGISPLYFDFDSLDSIGIATGGSDPSLSTPGVTLNLVTKRGTNGLLGSARILYTGGARWDYGIEAGGPLWRDRLWLWGAGASNSFLGQTFLLPTGEPVRSQETQKYWNGKLNAEPVPANTLTLSYLNFERVARGRGAGPSRSQPSTWDQTFPAQSYKIEDSQVLSARLFASLYFSYLPVDSTNTPEGGLDKQADIDTDYVWRNSFRLRRFRGPQHQTGLTASAFFDTGDLRHELKFGFGYRRARLDSLSAWPGDQLIGYQPFQLAAITRTVDQKIVLNYYNAYLGDTIQAGRLTVNVAARFDYQQGKNLPSAVPANPLFRELLPAVQYGGDSGYPITWRLLQPRVGATLALGRDRKSLLRASYSRFSSQLGREISEINAFPGSSAYLYYGWNDVNRNGHVEPGEVDLSDPQGFSNVDPKNPGSAVPVNQIASHLKPPTTDEFILGIERQISSDLSASLAYTHRLLRNSEFSPLIGTSRGSYRYIANAVGSATFDGFVLNFSEPYYGLTTVPPPVGSDIQNRPDYEETYDGMELQLIKRFSHGWMLRASFGYNDWQQHLGAGAIVNPNNEVPGTNATGPVVDGVINSTWQFNVSGMVQLPWGIEVAANFFGRQGFPIPYSVEVVTHDTRDSRPSLQIGQVTAYRLPDVFELDVHVERPFRIGSTVTISPAFDCFNMLNSHTVLQRSGRVGSYDAEGDPAFTQDPSFNAAGEVLSSRAFRGGVRISF
jgi:hypothetical protein